MVEKLNANVPTGIYFRGIHGMLKPYPSWRYHKLHPPILVHNTEEDEKAKAGGWEKVWAPITANRDIVNWYWDIEDMSPKQLVVYAQEEFGVDLPIDAKQDKLMKAVLELIKNAPNNRNRLVLMAHTLKFNYDETIKEIREMSVGGRPESSTFYERKVIEL